MWGEITALENSPALRADIPEAAEVRDKIRLLKGVLQWQLEWEFQDRLWRIRRNLTETGEALVAAQRSRRQIDETMRLEPLRFDELSSRVYDLGPRIESIKMRVDDSLADQRAFLAIHSRWRIAGAKTKTECVYNPGALRACRDLRHLLDRRGGSAVNLYRNLVAVVAILSAALLAAPAEAARPKDKDTIGSLDNKDVEVRTGSVIHGGSGLARDNYRAFLDLVSDDPELRAEAMRRLGDLELEATEAEQLTQNIDALDHTGYNNAVGLYQQLLQAYPDYRRNDTVLYQLARAYEIGGRNEDALATLDEVVARYPGTLLIDEVQFRRGEMLFLQKDYNRAEAAYQDVVRYGDKSRFFEQSLYKLGWSQFKLAWHEDSLAPFFELLDRKIGDVEIGEGEERLQSLTRAERELVEDTFRVLSISFSYMEGAESIDTFLAGRGNPRYSYVIYRNLGDLYLEKERFQDAAVTYEAFVKQDPYHPKAPLLQVEVIEAYKQGGFPSLVLDGKKGFVERYGMDGEFWVRNPRENNTEVAAHLKANLTDLAQYYHAEAQKDGEKSDYQEAANWYRKYLAYFPGEADSANTNFLLAEILFESEDYQAATHEYERTSYEYEPHPKSSEAGYAAILAYREHEKQLNGAAKKEWHSQYLDSGLKFADSYPNHPESGAVLTTVAEDLFQQNQFDLAIAVGQAVVAKQPAVDPKLQRTAWTVIAHSQFDLGNFTAAESSYYSLRNFTPANDSVANQEIKDRIASSIYKQGEQARDAGNLEMAVTHFTRLGEAVPDSDIRATAEYDAAAALINLLGLGSCVGCIGKVSSRLS